MKLNYKEQLPKDFAGSSRVWIYQGNRLFTLSEAVQIEDMLNEFAANWQSHGTPVKGYGNLFFGQFIILIADETASGVSGCSTDSSVRLIKHIEQLFNVNLFDRLLLAFFIKEKIQVLPLSQLDYAIGNDFINAETLYFNNTILTKEALENNWIIPVKDSWLSKKILQLPLPGK
jgi:hypothetical protein